MSHLTIGGAGDLAREALGWVQDAGHGVGAFLVTTTAFVPEGGKLCGLPVLGLDAITIDKQRLGPMVLGIGSWATKAALAALGELAPAVVHPRAVVGRRNVLGAGTLVCPGAVITVDCEIGSGLTMNLNATIGHGCKLGEWITLSPGAKISGNCEIGHGVFFGTNASVIPGIKIAAGAVIGAGAVVTRDITEPGTYVGVPARCVRR